MKTSSSLKLKIWTPLRSILPPKPLVAVALEGADEVEAATAKTLEMAILDQSVRVVLLEAEVDVAADDRKRDQIVQKDHEVRAATILSSWTAQTRKDLAAVDEINAMIRIAIPILMTVSTANLSLKK